MHEAVMVLELGLDHGGVQLLGVARLTRAPAAFIHGWIEGLRCQWAVCAAAQRAYQGFERGHGYSQRRPAPHADRKPFPGPGRRDMPLLIVIVLAAAHIAAVQVEEQ